MVDHPHPVPLSVLDLAPVTTATTPAQALERATELARHAEALGFHRFWVAEHHNIPMIASSAPDVLIAHLASQTDRIRLGSGGVMLPNHAPLVVAERFAMLEALHPGRIDLGIGRAPGTDQRTAAALRRDHGALGERDFLALVEQLRSFLDGDFPADHPYAGMRAIPGPGPRPPLWLLGSSTFSAQAAALLGERFSFAHHIGGSRVAVPALELYRERFQPTERLAAPQAKLTVSAVCADTEEQARDLATSGALAIARLFTGKPAPIASPAEVAAHAFTEHERPIFEDYLTRGIIGDPETVAARLRRLLERTGADELMITASIYDPAAHRRSLELIADAMGVQPPARVATAPAPPARST
ncbi:MAG: LLM class flavin-dependent oxidoreductase [Solirubrobacterales bacterium]